MANMSTYLYPKLDTVRFIQHRHTCTKLYIIHSSHLQYVFRVTIYAFISKFIIINSHLLGQA
jgi:hypothetical protein